MWLTVGAKRVAILFFISNKTYRKNAKKNIYSICRPFVASTSRFIVKYWFRWLSIRRFRVCIGSDNRALHAVDMLAHVSEHQALKVYSKDCKQEIVRASELRSWGIQSAKKKKGTGLSHLRLQASSFQVFIYCSSIVAKPVKTSFSCLIVHFKWS